MAKGDHLTVDRDWYVHHGIDVGDGQVVHYGRGVEDKRNACVELVPWSIFANGRSVRTVDSPRSYAPDTVIARARRRLGERCYDLFDNNCEAFVSWCRSGQPVSRQVALGEACTERAAAIGSKLFCRPVYTRTIERAFAQKAVSVLAKRPMAGWILADAVHGGVEMLAIRRGHPRAAARRLARGSGAATAAGVGLVSAGPMGAAVGLVGWMTGNWIGESTVETLKHVVRTVARTSAGDQRRRMLG